MHEVTLISYHYLRKGLRHESDLIGEEVMTSIERISIHNRKKQKPRLVMLSSAQ